MSANTPPGPKGRWLLGSTLEFMRDPLGFLSSAHARYGDVVYVNCFPSRVYCFFHPEHIGEILTRRAASFGKSSLEKKLLGRVMGAGLLSDDGALHRRHRRMMLPMFHVSRITRHASAIANLADRMTSGWRTGESRDINAAMHELTIAVMSEALFGIDITETAREFADALVELQTLGAKQLMRFIALPEWLPVEDNRRLNRSLELVDRVISELIDQRIGDARSCAPEAAPDFLSALLAVRDRDGSPMSTQEVRDEVMTLFLAGHETLAHTLSWAWYLLAQNPEIEARFHSVVDETLAERVPGASDLGSLSYVTQVVKESLRLYPPGWTLAVRQVVQRTEIAGYRLPKGSLVLIPPYVLHRQARYFPDPERFDPDRFAPDNEREIPKFAYLPFGGGIHLCVGNNFALMEGTLILATLARRHRFELEPGHTVTPEPRITLGPKHGVPVRLVARGA